MKNTFDDNLEWIKVQVAERMGWRFIEYSRNGYLIGYPPGRNLYSPIPSYVQDIKAAWMLVEYLAAFGIRAKVQSDRLGTPGGTFLVEFEFQEKLLSRAQTSTAALAICQAFLGIKSDVLSCAIKQLEQHA